MPMWPRSLAKLSVLILIGSALGSTACTAESVDSDVEAADQAFSWTSTLARGQHRPTQIEVDATHVYWSTYDASGDSPPFVRRHTLLRVAKSGGAIETIAVDQSDLATFALDGTHVYWLTQAQCRAGAPANGSALRAPKAGGPVEVLTSGFACGVPSANTQMVVDDDNVYFSGSHGIHVLPKTGGPATMFAPAGTNPFSSLPSTVFLREDASTIYWGDSYGPLWAQAKVGGAKTKLLDGSPWQGALDASFVYFIREGKVFRVAKTGGVPEAIGEAGVDSASAVTADDTHVYYSNVRDKVIYRIAKDGSSRAKRFASGEKAHALAVDGTNVFFPHYGTEYPSFMVLEYVESSGVIRRRTK